MATGGHSYTNWHLELHEKRLHTNYLEDLRDAVLEEWRRITVIDNTERSRTRRADEYRFRAPL